MTAKTSLKKLQKQFYFTLEILNLQLGRVPAVLLTGAHFLEIKKMTLHD